MWILESIDPEYSLTFRMLPGPAKTMGRAPRADFIVDAPLVSRLHCQLTATDDALEVKDLGSTNGTFANGKRITDGVLRDGDRLTVGRVIFAIKADESAKTS